MKGSRRIWSSEKTSKARKVMQARSHRKRYAKDSKEYLKDNAICMEKLKNSNHSTKLNTKKPLKKPPLIFIRKKKKFTSVKNLNIVCSRSNQLMFRNQPLFLMTTQKHQTLMRTTLMTSAWRFNQVTLKSQAKTCGTSMKWSRVKVSNTIKRCWPLIFILMCNQLISRFLRNSCGPSIRRSEVRVSRWTYHHWSLNLRILMTRKMRMTKLFRSKSNMLFKRSRHGISMRLLGLKALICLSILMRRSRKLTKRWIIRSKK